MSSFQVIRIIHHDPENTPVEDNITENIVIYKNLFHDIAPEHINQNDAVAVNSDIGGQNIWIIQNSFTNIGGDSIQLASDLARSDENYVLPSYIYIGKNTSSYMDEEFLDMKIVHDVIASQNIYHRLKPEADPPEIGGGGIIAGIGEDTIPTQHRDNIWILFNEIYDVGSAAINFYERIAGTQPTEHYAIGNLAYNVHTSGGSGACFQSAAMESMYWINNSCYNSDRGTEFTGSYENEPYDNSWLSTTQKLVVVNNIFGDINSESQTGYSMQLYADTASLARSVIKNNIFYNGGVDTTYKVGVPDGVGSTTYDNYADFCTDYPGFCTGSLEDNPDHINPPSNFKLQSDSPAIDAGDNTIRQAAEATFFARYGISIAVDYDGNGAPIGVYDMGAYEYDVAMANDILHFGAGTTLNWGN